MPMYSMNIFNKKYGYWICNGVSFTNKLEALIYASQVNKPVRLVYHDSIWRNFDRSQLGKYSLDYLYKQRAEQLREKYEYLILYYSGGADSHNILETFLKNKIKLDEICIKWPKPLLEGKFYQPNQVDRTARNYWSEWDYSIKPTLEKIKQTHPEIKISIKDYTNNLDNLKFEKVFDIVNHTRSGAMLYSSAISDSQFLIKKNIGHIFGVDKPLLANIKNKIYMFFSDLALSILQPSEIDNESTEAFYWSPDFPILTFEMAYQVSQYYLLFPEHQKYLWFNNVFVESNTRTQFQNDIVKKFCYTTWDNRFQADKPLDSARTDKWFWFFENSEFEKIVDVYQGELKNRISQISENFLDISSQLSPGVKTIIGDLFFIRDM